MTGFEPETQGASVVDSYGAFLFRRADTVRQLNCVLLWNFGSGCNVCRVTALQANMEEIR